MTSCSITPTAIASVQLVQLGALPSLHVRNAQAEALIALQGGQLLHYARPGEQPLIWLSERAEFAVDQSVRGGIPVCWPWFGDLARNPAAVRDAVPHPGAPAHGLVRTLGWLLDGIAEDADGTTIALSFPTSALSAAWPHSAELTLTFHIGATLRLQLRTANTGPTPLAFSQALHTYFAISDIGDVEVRGLDGARYIDTLQGWHEFRQDGAVRAAGEIDRIYQDVPAQLLLHDAGWQRDIHLRTRNSTSAIVWNPHVEKARRLSQFAEDAWQRMLCIETANVMADAVHLEAGAEHVLELEIWSTATEAEK